MNEVFAILFGALVLLMTKLLILSSTYECPKKCARCYWCAWVVAIIIGIGWLIGYFHYV